jgi:glycosyltransferase involved in cell wall biosynthesis
VKLNPIIAVIKVALIAKPLLVKLLPIKFLRNVKKNMVTSAMKKLRRESCLKPFNRKAFSDGVNLIGYIQGEIGLAQSCRLVAHGLQEAEMPFTIYNYKQVSDMRFNDNSWNYKISEELPYNVNIFHINPYELPLAYFRLGRDKWDERYNIAFWLWELEKFPEEWEDAFLLADEIWTPSEFASQSIIGKPVHTIPYALSMTECGDYGRTFFELPEEFFLFLCMYDCNSTMERKNPLGAISAYKLAFSKDDKNVGIVLKINNPQQKDIEFIKRELYGYSNIFLIAEVMDKPQVNALISCVDVFVSLHRAEGFGLVMAEAMMLGTPVIATNWSSNTEFMDNDVACMVDCELVQIEKDIGQYKAGNRWAEPDINQAAEYMKELRTNEAKRKQLTEKAKAHILEHLSPQKAADLITRRINEIYTEAAMRHENYSGNNGGRQG